MENLFRSLQGDASAVTRAPAINDVQGVSTVRRLRSHPDAASHWLLLDAMDKLESAPPPKLSDVELEQRTRLPEAKQVQPPTSRISVASITRKLADGLQQMKLKSDQHTFEPAPAEADSWMSRIMGRARVPTRIQPLHTAPQTESGSIDQSAPSDEPLPASRSIPPIPVTPQVKPDVKLHQPATPFWQRVPAAGSALEPATQAGSLAQIFKRLESNGTATPAAPSASRRVPLARRRLARR